MALFGRSEFKVEREREREERRGEERKTRPGHLVMPDPPCWLGQEKRDGPTDRPTGRPTKPFVGRPPGSGKYG